jgi:Transglycosylase SLT domain
VIVLPFTSSVAPRDVAPGAVGKREVRRLERIAFGRRARRRARLRRIAVRAWVLTLVGTALGVPAPTGIDLLARLGPASTERGVEASEATAATVRFRRQAFGVRPPERPEREADGPSRERQAPDTTPATIPEIIGAAAVEYGVDPGVLLSIARCESDLDPQAQSPEGYHGLFQFDATTWAEYGYGSIYDPTAQARTAAELVAAGESERWPNCA